MATTGGWVHVKQHLQFYCACWRTNVLKLGASYSLIDPSDVVLLKIISLVCTSTRVFSRRTYLLKHKEIFPCVIYTLWDLLQLLHLVSPCVLNTWCLKSLTVGLYTGFTGLLNSIITLISPISYLRNIDRWPLLNTFCARAQHVILFKYTFHMGLSERGDKKYDIVFNESSSEHKSLTFVSVSDKFEK